MSMKVLITGGCGFIGSHLVENALSKGFDVRVLGLTNNLANVDHLLKENKIEFVRGDVSDPAVCRKVVRGCDMVSHLAALVSTDQSIQDPKPFWEVNVKGTFNMLDAARQEGVERFHLHSSCEMLGDVEFPHKADENYPVYIPKSPYAVSKFSSEAYCRSYYLTYGCPIVITRGFNTFGPRQKAGSMGAMIPNFLVRALEGKPPLIYGDGQQTRDFTYVKDIAEGIYRCLTSDKVIGETVHLCSGIDRKAVDVAKLAIDVCGKSDELKPEHITARFGEMRRSIGDNSKAKRLLNWEPKMDFEQGVRNVADFISERIRLELPLYMKN